MTRREPPRTEEGLYALHDFRSIDWDAWRAAPADERERAIAEGAGFLDAQDEAEAGDFAAFVVLGHKADLLLFWLRPTMAALDEVERSFERTSLAAFTDRSTSYVSVTEASGYTEAAAGYFEEDGDVDPGLARYIESRLRPRIPDTEFVNFYPMSKRREPEYNWYDLPFEERRELMGAHGEIGREYAGKVTQIITGSVGLDDWEWGVTLFADDVTNIKRLLTEMRFDHSTSKYAEFGPFYVGRRIAPADLGAVFAGEPVPTADRTDDPEMADSSILDELDRLDAEVDVPAGAHGLVFRSDALVTAVAEEVDGLRGNFEHYDSHVATEVFEDGDGSAIVSVWTTERAADTAAGFLAELPGVTDHVGGPLGGGAKTSETTAHGTSDDATDEIRATLEDLDIYAGKPHGEDVYAMVLYSTAAPDELLPAVSSLRDGFDRYDTHVRTAVYEGTATDRLAIVSLWETQSAADTAGGYLADLPDIVARAGAEGDDESGFGTMGMFYTVKPEHRENFVGTFEDVGGLLAEMDGHVETDLMVNVDDENDMFIASAWRSKEDAMAFFRSDAFSDTVRWGRDVLADRPRHVFLA